MLGDERPADSVGAGPEHHEGTDPAKGKPGRPRKLKAGTLHSVNPPTPGLDMAAVFELIGKMSAENRETMLEFAKEIRKPTPKEVREEAENEKKEERIRNNRLVQLENAKKQAAADEARASGCSHASYNPATGITKHSWRAQVHTPAGVKPYFVPTCDMCHYQIRDGKGDPVHFPASVDMLTNGVNLDQYIALDLDKLKTWYKQTAEQVA